MNSGPTREVQRKLRGWAALGPLLLAGCVAVDGGSVEAGWVINTADNGIRINCGCARFRTVRLILEQTPRAAGEAVVDPCADEPSCRFSCEGGVGATKFVIPEGRYAMSVVPEGEQGELMTPADGVTIPPPNVREIVDGELVNLGVNLFLVAQTRLGGPSVCEAEWLQ